MAVIIGSPFDGLAESYDQLWSTAPAGVYQRNAVWKILTQLFSSGQTILDVGCGTGVDAAYLQTIGVQVDGVDASSEMIRAARKKGVNATHLAAENLGELRRTYDGAISNFGVLNCVANLEDTASSLGGLIRPGGYLAVCTMGAFCVWEFAYFFLRGHLAKSARRLRRGTIKTSIGVDVQYPTVKQIARAFQPYFRLITWKGVGIAVPPSYIPNTSDRQLLLLAKIDSLVATWPLLRAISDHRLLIFIRI